jgi:hypothetical protein
LPVKSSAEPTFTRAIGTVSAAGKHDVQRRGAVGSRPQLRGSRRDVADDHAVRHLGPDRLGRDRRCGAGKHKERDDQKPEVEPSVSNNG